MFSAQLGRLQTFALSLMAAGGVGNLIDRWTAGHSTDFLNLGIGPIRTGIFNVADATLMAGCFLLLWAYRLEMLRNRKT